MAGGLENILVLPIPRIHCVLNRHPLRFMYHNRMTVTLWSSWQWCLFVIVGNVRINRMKITTQLVSVDTVWSLWISLGGHTHSTCVWNIRNINMTCCTHTMHLGNVAHSLRLVEMVIVTNIPHVSFNSIDTTLRLFSASEAALKNMGKQTKTVK